MEDVYEAPVVEPAIESANLVDEPERIRLKVCE